MTRLATSVSCSIIWKGAEFFGFFLRFVKFYFDYFARWDNLGRLGFRYELLCARTGNGPQIKTKIEIILQENGGIHRKKHKILFSIHVLVVLAQDARIHFP